MGYIIFLAVVIVLMVIGGFRAKKEQACEAAKKEQEEIEKRTMPSGTLVAEDDKLLAFTEEDFDKFSRDDLMWLINYIGHRIPDGCRDENEPWSRIFVFASNVKNKKHWYAEIDRVLD